MDAPLHTLFFGTPDFSVPALQSLLANKSVKVGAVFTQPDKPAGRGGHMRESPVKVLATEHKIPVLQPLSVKKERDAILQKLQIIGAFDLAVVAAYGQILPTWILELPRLGSINIHASLLPRWRGAAPIQRALLAGDKKTGICLMQMDAGLDTGAVLCSSELEIGEDETFGSLHDKLSLSGAQLLNSNIERIGARALIPQPQPEAGVTYAEKVKAAEAEIDWSKDATTIERQVRGFNPFPGAYTFIGDKRFKIFAARNLSAADGQSAPGTVTFADHANLKIACGAKTALAVTEVQIEGKRRMPIEEFQRGSSIFAGTVLGR